MNCTGKYCQRDHFYFCSMPPIISESGSLNDCLCSDSSNDKNAIEYLRK